MNNVCSYTRIIAWVYSFDILNGAQTHYNVSHAMSQIQMVVKLLNQILALGEVPKEDFSSFNQPKTYNFVDITTQSWIKKAFFLQTCIRPVEEGNKFVQNWVGDRVEALFWTCSILLIFLKVSFSFFEEMLSDGEDFGG